MIKCKYLLLVVCLVWAGSILNAQWCVAPDSPIEQQSGISKTVKDQGNGRVLYSYCSSDAAVTAKSGIGSNTDDDVKVTTAIRLSEGMMGLLKGRNIYSLKVGIAADADDATVFIRKEDGTILWQITKVNRIMSNIKVGDKVRFLNSTGGGVVRSFKGKDQVLVEDEDGFEVPALIRECVVVGDSEMQVHSSRRSPLPSVTQAAVPQPKKPEPQPEVEKVTETIEGERLNIYLAYLPIEPAKVIQGSGYETYFINDSNYYLFFNYMNRQNNSWISRYNGIVEPNTQIFLEEFGKEELNDLERICVQLIAFKKDKPYSLKNAISVELHLDTVKFYKQHCFMENDFFDEDAMVYPIVRQDIPEKELLISAAELQQAMQQKVHEDRRVPQTIVKKKVTDSSILEVDLHITELLDNTNGLSNADMLDYQLEKFHEVLAKYAANKGQKIVFIHGKGDGVLRKAIEKELKTKYKQYYYQDASFREYGFGATMVTIK